MWLPSTNVHPYARCHKMPYSRPARMSPDATAFGRMPRDVSEPYAQSYSPIEPTSSPHWPYTSPPTLTSHMYLPRRWHMRTLTRTYTSTFALLLRRSLCGSRRSFALQAKPFPPLRPALIISRSLNARISLTCLCSSVVFHYTPDTKLGTQFRLRISSRTRPRFLTAFLSRSTFRRSSQSRLPVSSVNVTLPRLRDIRSSWPAGFETAPRIGTFAESFHTLRPSVDKMRCFSLPFLKGPSLQGR